jgi:general secretion pathway protein D
MNALMSFSFSPTLFVAPCLLALGLLSGCATYLEERRADQLLADGQVDAGLASLAELAKTDPAGFRLKYIQTRDGVLRDLLQKARRFASQKKTQEARETFEAMLRLDPHNDAALAGLAALSREARESEQMAQAKTSLDNGDAESALRALNEVLLENPGQAEAMRQRQGIEIERNRGLASEPVLAESLRKPVTLELRDVGIQTVL